MRKILVFILLLNVLGLAASRLNEALEARQAFIAKFDDSEKKYLADVRDSILTFLQANNNDESLRYVEILKDSSYKDYALDKYELLQVYFLTNQLDSAIVTFVRDYDNHLRSYAQGAYAHQYQWYSAFDDKLIEFLDAKMNLTNRDVLQEQLNRISNSDISQELKDLAELMKMEFVRNVIKSKSIACFSEEVKKGKMSEVCSQRDEIYEMRYGVWKDDFVEKDSVFYDSLLSMYASFENEYPDSEFRGWAIKHGIIIRRNRESYNSYKYYYRERFYTGGIGGEAFILLDSELGEGYELNIALQYKRFMLTFSYSFLDCSVNCQELKNKFDGWLFLLGWDVFETKWFKIAPFIGFYDPYVTGLQLEFRPWISELGRDVPIGGYLSFKAKYELRYANRFEEKIRNNFFLGVGFHIW